MRVVSPTRQPVNAPPARSEVVRGVPIPDRSARRWNGGRDRDEACVSTPAASPVTPVVDAGFQGVAQRLDHQWPHYYLGVA